MTITTTDRHGARADVTVGTDADGNTTLAVAAHIDGSLVVKATATLDPAEVETIVKALWDSF